MNAHAKPQPPRVSAVAMLAPVVAGTLMAIVMHNSMFILFVAISPLTGAAFYVTRKVSRPADEIAIEVLPRLAASVDALGMTVEALGREIQARSTHLDDLEAENTRLSALVAIKKQEAEAVVGALENALQRNRKRDLAIDLAINLAVASLAFGLGLLVH